MGRRGERDYTWVGGSFLKPVVSHLGSQRWVALGEMEVGGGDHQLMKWAKDAGGGKRKTQGGSAW